MDSVNEVADFDILSIDAVASSVFDEDEDEEVESAASPTPSLQYVLPALSLPKCISIFPDLFLGKREILSRKTQRSMCSQMSLLNLPLRRYGAALSLQAIPSMRPPP